jgi:hypothetical protein
MAITFLFLSPQVASASAHACCELGSTDEEKEELTSAYYAKHTDD